jgi:hypothetical protein
VLAIPQTTGQISHIDDATGVATPVGYGFSGQGFGYNNPSMEYAENVGPIPSGFYSFGFGRKWHGMTDVMPITPVLAFQFGRPGGYLFHGANRDPAKAATSSQGCIILSKQLRESINRSSDRCLRVVH